MLRGFRDCPSALVRMARESRGEGEAGFKLCENVQTVATTAPRKNHAAASPLSRHTLARLRQDALAMVDFGAPRFPNASSTVRCWREQTLR